MNKEEMRPIVLMRQETHYLVDKQGRVYNTKCNQWLTPHEASQGYIYYKVGFRGKEYSLRADRLVAELFVFNPNPSLYTNVEHLNGDYRDNNVSNLEWTNKPDPIFTDRGEIITLKNGEIVYENDVRSFRDSYYNFSRFGDVYNFCPLYMIKMSPDYGGDYDRLEMLYNVQDRLFVHRCVYESFNGPIPPGMGIEHIDGNKKNNRIENLRLTTELELGHKRGQENRYIYREHLYTGHTDIYRSLRDGATVAFGNKNTARLMRAIRLNCIINDYCWYYYNKEE